MNTPNRSSALQSNGPGFGHGVRIISEEIIAPTLPGLIKQIAEPETAGSERVGAFGKLAKKSPRGKATVFFVQRVSKPARVR